MNGNDRESALDKELRFHIEERVAALMASGVGEPEARRRVRQEFGGIEQVREECRDVRPGQWVELWFRDMRHALRGMRKNPASAAAILLTVAVCVTVNAAIFAVVDSVLLRPLPFTGADRLISMSNQYPNAGITDQNNSSAGDYLDRAGTLPAVAEHALYETVSRPVDRGDARAPIQMEGLTVTPSFFPLLRVQAAEGRLFVEQESEIGKHRVTVITSGLQRELFGGESAVGKELRISGAAHTVIGVLPDGFRFAEPSTRFFVPIALDEESRRARHSNNYRYLGRLRDGATVAQAQAQVDALNARLLEEQPEFRELLTNAKFRTHVNALQPWLVRHIRQNLQMLWAGALLVLLVGAVNVAGLSLARANARTRETATRVALGAARADILRQALTEGVAPALLGGVLGMLLGLAALRIFDRELLPGAAEIRPGILVVLYALGGALLAGVLSGLASLAPLRGLRIAGAIRDGARGGTVRSAKLRRIFVVAQVAIAFVLLSGAGLLTASLRELWRMNPGFTVDGVWTASTYLPSTAYANAASLRTAVDRIIAGIAALPGVTLVGSGSAVPFQTFYDDNVVLAEGRTMRPGESAISPIRLFVTPGYMETLGVRASQGRLFDARDTSQSLLAVIVDEKLARRFWPGQNPVGQRMYYPDLSGRVRDALTVVGVVPSIRLQDPSGAGNPNGVYYIPASQSPQRALRLLWRGRPEVVAALRAEFARLAPGAALFDIRSMEERQESMLGARRTTQQLALVFAGVAMLLTAIGLHGLLAFLVTQRRREIGIRLAIGCTQPGIYGLFLRDGAWLVIAGLAAGLGITLSLQNWLSHQLYGVGATEPVVLLLGGAFLTAVSMAAISIPAWRASRVDPVSVLGES